MLLDLLRTERRGDAGPARLLFGGETRRPTLFTLPRGRLVGSRHFPRRRHQLRFPYLGVQQFRGFTAQGHVRHAVFKGLRADKPAREIVRETPMPTKKKPVAKKVAKKSAATPRPTKPATAKTKPKPDEGAVKFSHPDRIYWTDVEITKQQLGAYYESVWEHMAPHVVNRPLALENHLREMPEDARARTLPRRLSCVPGTRGRGDA